MDRFQGAIRRLGAHRTRGLCWLLSASAVLVVGTLWAWHTSQPAGPLTCGDPEILDEMGALSRTLMESIVAANAAYHDPERIGLIYPEGRFQIGISGVQETTSVRFERLCRASLELATPHGFNAARMIEYSVIQDDAGAQSFAWGGARKNLEELNAVVMGPFCKAEPVH